MYYSHNVCRLQPIYEKPLEILRMLGRIAIAPVKRILTEQHGVQNHPSGPHISWLAVIPPPHCAENLWSCNAHVNKIEVMTVSYSQ